MSDSSFERSASLIRLRRQSEATMERIHRSFPEEAEAIAYWRETLPVALVMGAPRGGTSVFKSVLARHPRSLAMAGEHRLFFTLLGLNYPDCGGEDEASDNAVTPPTARLLIDFILTSSFYGPELTWPDARETLRYALDWALRLPLQWSGRDIDTEAVIAVITQAVAKYRASGVADPERLDRTVILALARSFPFIDPSLYDGFGGKAPSHPESITTDILPIVEITPFVVPRPRTLKRPNAPVSLLLLKASSDPFRFQTLRALFADRPVKILRLLRNPMASINGLLNGWAHPAFWQHDLSALEDIPVALRYWCFDLFPGWHAAARAGDLQAIATRQWTEPNRRLSHAALIPGSNESWHTFKFESFQASFARRAEMIDQASAALGLGIDPDFAATIATPRNVNSTAQPRIARWRSDRPDLIRLLDVPELRQIAAEIGYDAGDINEWL